MARSLPLSASQSRAVLSLEAVSTRRPSGLKTASETASVWPWKVAFECAIGDESTAGYGGFRWSDKDLARSGSPEPDTPAPRHLPSLNFSWATSRSDRARLLEQGTEFAVRSAAKRRQLARHGDLLLFFRLDPGRDGHLALRRGFLRFFLRLVPLQKRVNGKRTYQAYHDQCQRRCPQYPRR